MGRSTKSGQPRTTPNSWNGKEKKRCVSCRKRAKDFFEGDALCRVHSPYREGFKTALELEKKESKRR